MTLINRILLVCLLVTTVVFGYAPKSSLAAVSLLPQPVIMDVQGQVQGIAKELEGKVQETYGNVTGSQKDKIVGKAKQYQGKAAQGTEDLKDKVGDAVDDTQTKIQGVAKDLQGKVQETYGNITDNEKDKIVGKLKQSQGQSIQKTASLRDQFDEFIENISGKD